MSFETLNKDVLLQVADDFAVDVEKTDTKRVIVAALVQNGVTWEMYRQAFPDLTDDTQIPPVADAPEKKVVVRPQPTVLLKMERANPKFEIRGYTFTKDHPFLPVKESDADYIISHEEGFRIAMPSEAEAFYS